MAEQNGMKYPYSHSMINEPSKGKEHPMPDVMTLGDPAQRARTVEPAIALQLAMATQRARPLARIRPAVGADQGVALQASAPSWLSSHFWLRGELVGRRACAEKHAIRIH
jgi:hypothetical protein